MKSRKVKRWLALGLAGMMALGTAACGSSSTAPAESTASTAGAETTADAAEASGEETASTPSPAAHSVNFFHSSLVKEPSCEVSCSPSSFCSEDSSRKPE